jgi:hypothetical protein
MNPTRNILIAMTLGLGLAGAAAAQPDESDNACPDVDWLTGDWRGEIEGTGRVMIFRFVEHDEECVTGNFDILDEDVDRVPYSDVELFEGQKVEVRSDAMEFVFKGKFQGGRLAGDLIQNDAIYELDLQRAEDPAQ